MKDAIKKKFSKLHDHVQEHQWEYVIVGSTLTVVFLSYVCIKQNKILESPIKLAMDKDDFRKMHEEGGWMVWDANPRTNIPKITLGVTEAIEKQRKDKAA